MHRIKSVTENLDLSGFFSAELSTSSSALALSFLLSMDPFAASGTVFLSVGIWHKYRTTFRTAISTLTENLCVKSFFGG